MGMGINTNLVSINAQRMLSHSSSGLATSMQRLSSGLRVNSAKDDAAGLAIAERMHSQIRGMNQAARNANDAISLLQTAEGATSKITDMLQRMREISVQSANATNSEDDRKALQAEVAQLKNEIDRIGSSTRFNGSQVFNQSRHVVAGSNPDALELLGKLKDDGWLAKAEKLVSDMYGINADNVSFKIDLTSKSDGPWGVGAFVRSTPTSAGPAVNIELYIDLADYKAMDETQFMSVLAHEMVHAIMARGQSWSTLQQADKSTHWFIEGVAEFVYGADARIAQEGGWDNVKMDSLTNWGDSTLDYASGYAAVRYLHDYLVTNHSGSDGIKDVLQKLQTETGHTLESAVRAAIGNNSTWSLSNFVSTYESAAGATSAPAWLNLTNTDSGSIGGKDADPTKNELSVADVIASAVPTSSDLAGFTASWQEISAGGLGPQNMLGFQVGANAGDFVYANVGSMNIGSLGLEKLTVETQDDATAALNQLDAAIDYVSSQRGNLGALMNRFEAVIATLNISSENASAARGRIIDADFAVETANLSRTQILQQAGTAMVAQANQLPQNVLSLLR